jgi:hypothetical protein
VRFKIAVLLTILFFRILYVSFIYHILCYTMVLFCHIIVVPKGVILRSSLRITCCICLWAWIPCSWLWKFLFILSCLTRSSALVWNVMILLFMLIQSLIRAEHLATGITSETSTRAPAALIDIDWTYFVVVIRLRIHQKFL